MNKRPTKRSLYLRIFILLPCLCIAAACTKPNNAATAFYYWKARFELNHAQHQLLKQTQSRQLYLRFFDVKWNAGRKQAYPEAIVSFKDVPQDLNVVPVIYITNSTIENLADTALKNLAGNCAKLISVIASGKHISYQTIQVDCDWSLKTEAKYFGFLKVFKKLTGKPLQATIRLHQVKYKHLTGVPPVERGVLMFYNMGKVNGVLDTASSIYNAADAERYLPQLKAYPLPLDLALPLFSWAIQIRDGKAVQVYQKVDRTLLMGSQFTQLPGTKSFRALNSFFWQGIYVKQSDIFKLEESNKETLEKAAGQLNKFLPVQPNRIVIFYELANIDMARFSAETLQQISADF